MTRPFYENQHFFPVTFTLKFNLFYDISQEYSFWQDISENTNIFDPVTFAFNLFI